MMNPFLKVDAGAVAEIIAALLPTAPAMTDSEREAFDARCSEGQARYMDERFGKLPDGAYRVLEQGSLAGWFYELEIDGDSVVLSETAGDRGRYELYGRWRDAQAVARREVERRHGPARAAAAVFKPVWGGCL